jgi:hypothetical protein
MADYGSRAAIFTAVKRAGANYLRFPKPLFPLGIFDPQRIETARLATPENQAASLRR